VLSAIVNAVGKLGNSSRGTKREKDKADISLRVGGLTSRPEGQEDEHLIWISGRSLRVGDEVRIKLVNTKRPRAHAKASAAGGNITQMREKKLFEIAKADYLRLRAKYEGVEP
jgi:hypothetical protein